MKSCLSLLFPLPSPFRALCAASLLLGWLAPGAAHAQAGSGREQDLPLPPIASAPTKIAVDGNLAEWSSIPGYFFNPLSSVVKSGGDPEIEAILANPASVQFRACYDFDALYVALEWRDRKPGNRKATSVERWYEGEGFELHLRTDRTLHLVGRPDRKGKLVLQARYGDETAWRNVAQQIGAAQAGKAGALTQELRIPWSAITKEGKPPGNSQVEIAADFAWNALPASILPKIRQAMMASDNVARGVTSYFLTAQPGMALRGPSGRFDWGTLDLSGTAASGDLAIAGPDGSTSLASLPVAKVESAPSLDGSLKGWAPESFQTAACLGALWGNRYTCRVAAQQDGANLYLTAHFVSAGSPTNSKMEMTGQGYSGGDSLQIRLARQGKSINLCGWLDASGSPALTCDQNNLPNPLLLTQGAQETFKDDGKGGYIQTLAIPWKLLFGETPKSTDEIKTTFQFWMVDKAPVFSIRAKTQLEKRPPLSVAYKMPASGAATVGLFDQEGKLLRWVARDAFREKGEIAEPWDGLDQWGMPVAPGSYVLKGIYHGPLGTDYKMSFNNPGNPTWSTPDDKGDWIGDESNPQGVATDGKWVYLASPDCEKGFSVIAVDENGQRQWGTKITDAPRCVSLAVAGDYLYALYSGPEKTNTNRVFQGKETAVGRAFLECFNKKTGKPERFTKGTPNLRVATWPYREEYFWMRDLRNNKSFSPANYAGQPRYAAYDVSESDNALGLAAVGDKLYASLFYENQLIEIDAVTGKPTGQSIPVPAPAGLHAPDAQTLLAVSGTQVLKVDLQTKQSTPLITSGLVAPFGVTTDAKGTLYVSDWGASFQIKAFDASGRFLRAVGKEGGRPWVGKWDADGMLLPRGIAVTEQGKLWVAEDDSSPRRVSVWDSQSGAFLKDYIGPTPYGGGTQFWVDPNDPTVMHSSCTRFKLDFEKKTYTPLATAFRAENRDDPFTPNGGESDWGHTEVRIHDGQEYLVSNVRKWLTTVFKRQGDRFRPVAALGYIEKRGASFKFWDGTETDTWDSDLGHHTYLGAFPECFKGHSGDNFSWTDLNGDFLVQPEEMRWVTPVNGPAQEGAQPQLGNFWGTAMSADWSYFASGNYQDQAAIYRLDVKGWTPAGAPIYDMAEARPIVMEPGVKAEGLFATRDNRLVASYGYENKSLNRSVFDCFDFNGKKLWSVAQPKRLEGDQFHATNAVGEFNIPGLGTVVGTWAWHGSYRPYLITTDGLYVGMLMENTLLGPASLWGESYKFYFQNPDGTPYIVNGGCQADHILAIKGLEAGAVGRFEGTYQLSEADVKKAAQVQTLPEPTAAPKPRIGVQWLDHPAAIDGDLSEWHLGEGVSLDGGKGRKAEIALGRDADHLYLAYKVYEHEPMRNGGNDWQTLFVTGDCVDLMLESDTKADPNRPNAVAGDKRLLFSLFQDQPVAVLYRPVVPGFSTPVRLSTATFDEIKRLDSAKVAIKRYENYYTVEVAVPLKDLEIDPKATGELRGDVGVIFADETGKNRALRKYYYNSHTEMVNDIPTEANLAPAQWGKISLPLGSNLVKNGGFEEPFAEKEGEGWTVEKAVNGNTVAITPDVAFTGHQSLMMETLTPVTFPPASYNDPDYRAFMKSANGGKGSAEAAIRQKFPVTANHQYSVRLRYRCEDFMPERKKPGHPRGYVLFGARLDWICERPAKGSSSGLGNYYESAPDWRTIKDFQGWDIPAPYTAPEGAVAASLVLYLRTNHEGVLPKLFVDDVECVDVTAKL